MARWVLPVPGGPKNTTFSRAVTKSSVPRWAISSRLRPRAWSKSNSSRLLRAGKRAWRMRPSPPCASLAATSRCRQAARNSSWDQDSARARSASRVTDWRSVGALSARVRNASSPVRSRAVVLAGIRPPLALVEAEGGVVVGQAAQLHLGLGRAARSGPMRLPQPGGGRQVGGVTDRLVPGPAARVVGDQAPVAVHADAIQVGSHLDAATDGGRVHGVVVGVQAHVVVTGQPQPSSPAGGRRDRRQRQHARTVGLDALGRRTAQGTPWSLVDQREPAAQLGVEVRRRAEGPPGQERGLQVPVGPFDQPLGLGVGRVAQHDPGAQHPTEGLRRLGQHAHPAASLADRALLVPDQRLGHPAELGEQLPPAGEQVLGGPRRQQPSAQPARVAAHHHQHRQPGRRAGLPEPHRQRDRWEPQVTLGQLPSRVRRSRRRIRRQVRRAQLSHPVTQHADRALPADPLGDHRGRHRRPGAQQLADLRLDRVHDRPTRRPLVPRRRLGRQRPPHGVPGNPRHPGDYLDRHPLGPVQPADLRPVLHAQHPASSPARLEPGSRKGSVFDCREGSVFTRRRQAAPRQRDDFLGCCPSSPQ
jgi:hypothetical protein